MKRTYIIFILLIQALMVSQVFAETQPKLGTKAAPISIEEVKPHVDNESALLIDARSKATYDYAHIPGAINIYPDKVDTLPWLKYLRKDTPVIIYCGSVTCGLSKKLGGLLVGRGFTNVALFEEGYKTWEASGYPIDGWKLRKKPANK